MLSETQKRFVERYDAWLETVTEGLMTVIQFYRDDYHEEGDRLLISMLDGFDSYGADNLTMQAIFASNEHRSLEWEQFQRVVTESKVIPELPETQGKVAALTQNVLPGFRRWQQVLSGMR